LDFIVTFTSILYEVIAGVLEELVPQQLIARAVPKNRFLAISLSALLGLVFPMCECGIVPVMRRLLRKGLPLGCCTAYLLAGPIINPVVILSTVVAFQTGMAEQPWQEAFQKDGRGPLIVYLRVAGGFFVAVITALIVERLYRKHGNALLTPLAQPGPLPQENEVPPPIASESPAEAHQEELEVTHVKPTFRRRLSNISETALHDFVDITVFLIIGSLLAASTRMFLSHSDVERLSTAYPVVVILSMMGLAAVLCLCSEADAFVAASFTSLPPSAKLAFLVMGPMLDIKLYFLYTRVFRRKLIFTIFGSVIVLSFIYSLLVHQLWLAMQPATATG
jgi:hypothetical protein